MLLHICLTAYIMWSAMHEFDFVNKLASKEVKGNQLISKALRGTTILQ